MFVTSYDLVQYISSDSLFVVIKLKAKYRLHGTSFCCSRFYKSIIVADGARLSQEHFTVLN